MRPNRRKTVIEPNMISYYRIPPCHDHRPGCRRQITELCGSQPVFQDIAQILRIMRYSKGTLFLRQSNEEIHSSLNVISFLK